MSFGNLIYVYDTFWLLSPLSLTAASPSSATSRPHQGLSSLLHIICSQHSCLFVLCCDLVTLSRTICVTISLELCDEAWWVHKWLLNWTYVLLLPEPISSWSFRKEYRTSLAPPRSMTDCDRASLMQAHGSWADYHNSCIILRRWHFMAALLPILHSVCPFSVMLPNS